MFREERVLLCSRARRQTRGMHRQVSRLAETTGKLIRPLSHLKDLLQEGEDILILQRCPVSASLQHADNVRARERLQLHTALQPLYSAEGLSASLPKCAGGAQRPQGGQLVLIPLQVSLQAQRVQKISGCRHRGSCLPATAHNTSGSLLDKPICSSLRVLPAHSHCFRYAHIFTLPCRS